MVCHREPTTRFIVLRKGLPFKISEHLSFQLVVTLCLPLICTEKPREGHSHQDHYSGFDSNLIP